MSNPIPYPKVEGERWVICSNCRIGWNHAQYLIDNPKGIFDNGQFTDPMTIEEWIEWENDN